MVLVSDYPWALSVLFMYMFSVILSSILPLFENPFILQKMSLSESCVGQSNDITLTALLT